MLEALLQQAVLCLALNVYHEARGEPLEGQYAVAHVTVNRSTVSGRGVCREVYRPFQFSWTHKRVKRARGEPWHAAQRVASDVLRGARPDITRGATYYHATRVRPGWTRRLVRAVRIGRHIFYHSPRQRAILAAHVRVVPRLPIHFLRGGHHEALIAGRHDTKHTMAQRPGAINRGVSLTRGRTR